MQSVSRMTGKTLFVTTGATVIFKELIEVVLQSEFLKVLVQNGVIRVILQYGAPSEGKSTFVNSLQTLGVEDLKQSDTSVIAKFGKLIIEGFDFTSDINSVISKSDLVVSHAGTGSILDVLRLHKPLIVVINSKLMNNHQKEIADELSNQGYLIQSRSSLNDLINAFNQLLNSSLQTFPEPNTSIINKILHEI